MEKESPLRILVVEDEALMRWAIAETLKPGGHTILQASDGAAALAVLHDPSAADVVLLDYHLPDSHDVALLARIRRGTADTCRADDCFRDTNPVRRGPQAWRGRNTEQTIRCVRTRGCASKRPPGCPLTAASATEADEGPLR